MLYLYYQEKEMSDETLKDGVVHDLPEDFKTALLRDSKSARGWQNLTFLARNEWICWIEDAKKAETRERRIGRAIQELNEGKKRPCCWPGCPHRK